MRASQKLPVVPDILSLLAIVALVAVVYLCSLPQTFHALAHRRADAVDLLSGAQDRVDKEAALFEAMVAASDRDSRDKLRQAVLDNERQFHDVARLVAEKLPEMTNDVQDLASQFDAVASAGWRAEAVAHGDGKPEAETIMREQFVPALAALRNRLQSLQRVLQHQHVSARLPARRALDRPVAALI